MKRLYSGSYYCLRYYFWYLCYEESANAIYVVPTGAIAFCARNSDRAICTCVYCIYLFVCLFDISYATSIYSIYTYSQISFSKLKASVDGSALPIFIFLSFYLSVLTYSTFAHNSSPCVSNEHTKCWNMWSRFMRK